MHSFGYFKMVRKHDDDFKHIKKRPRHYHAKCITCEKLQDARLNGFDDDSSKKVWQAMFQEHENEKLGWRKWEKARQSEVVNNPADTILLSYDDTVDIGFPKLTNRDVKNMTKSRFFVTPLGFIDYSSREAAYVYTSKNRFKGGGNRLCTVLYHALRKIKYGSLPNKSARRLILHADIKRERK